jgi:hypothetical protein
MNTLHFPLHLRQACFSILTIHRTRPSWLAQITTSADQMPISRSNTTTHIHPRACLHPGLVGSCRGEQAPLPAQSHRHKACRAVKMENLAQDPHVSRAHPRNCIIVAHTSDVIGRAVPRNVSFKKWHAPVIECSSYLTISCCICVRSS